MLKYIWISDGILVGGCIMVGLAGRSRYRSYVLARGVDIRTMDVEVVEVSVRGNQGSGGHLGAIKL